MGSVPQCSQPEAACPHAIGLDPGCYDQSFYARYRDGSRRSAGRVLPLVNRWVHPKSVVDVGCGIGAWLSVWLELGMERVLGIDGDYVNRSSLMIPQSAFLPHDLATPLRSPGQFDLVTSVEVAEHIPAANAEVFIETLTSMAPVVLFSAAIPGQGGDHHVNEQWPEYWAEMFAARGYEVVDCVRPAVWDDDAVEYFYAQNSLLYVRSDRLTEFPELASLRRTGPLARVHPRKWEEAQRMINDPTRFSLRPLMAAVPGAFRRAVRNRLRWAAK